jgi:hypothetical protein
MQLSGQAGWARHAKFGSGREEDNLGQTPLCFWAIAKAPLTAFARCML